MYSERAKNLIFNKFSEDKKVRTRKSDLVSNLSKRHFKSILCFETGFLHKGTISSHSHLISSSRKWQTISLITLKIFKLFRNRTPSYGTA